MDFQQMHSITSELINKTVIAWVRFTDGHYSNRGVQTRYFCCCRFFDNGYEVTNLCFLPILLYFWFIYFYAGYCDR